MGTIDSTAKSDSFVNFVVWSIDPEEDNTSASIENVHLLLIHLRPSRPEAMHLLRDIPTDPQLF